MSQHWLWGIIPFGVVSLAVLSVMIWRLVGLNSEDFILSAPLVAEQEIFLDIAGPMTLHGEGPRFTSAFGNLEYRLTDLERNLELGLSRILLKSASSGISTSRLSLRSFETETKGRYRLTIIGLPDTAAEGHNIVITHNRRGSKIGPIVAIVFSAIGVVASLALTLVVFILNHR